MAAVRAPTMAKRTAAICAPVTPCPCAAIVTAARAKGRAKTVWLNFTIFPKVTMASKRRRTTSWPDHPADRRGSRRDQRGTGRLRGDRRDIDQAGPLAGASAPRAGRPKPRRHRPCQSEARSQVRGLESARPGPPFLPTARGRTMNQAVGAKSQRQVRGQKGADVRQAVPMCRFERGQSTTGARCFCASAMSWALAQTICTRSGGRSRQRRRVIRDRQPDPNRACACRPELAARPALEPSARCRRAGGGFRLRLRRRGST